MDKNLPRSQKATLFFGAAIVSFLCLSYPTQAQSSASQNQQTVQSDTQQDRQAVQSDTDQSRRDVQNSADRRDVANFDQFLDSHREIAEQVRKDPSLLNNRTFLQNHPALQTYLQDNPTVRDQLRQSPNGFMHQEDA